ncbi:hypothetical protein N1F78_06510 [Seonamhaeicola sp. MEBiC1930]|uniref:hypothetical protein n=1 Tax=Seonamhaeicola sp. MEBiC01930 TaxID=2976768 RepID=UPI003243CEDD
MSDKKHIDRLFQETFKDFEVAPSDAIWKGIKANLKKKKNKRIIPIWWRYAGVAALLMLLLTVGGVYLNNNNTIEVVNEEDSNLNINNLEVKTPVNFNEESTTIATSNEKVDVPNNQESASSSSNYIVSQKESSISEASVLKNSTKSSFYEKTNNNFNQSQENSLIAKKTEGTNNNNIAIENSVEDKNELLQNKSTQINAITNNIEALEKSKNKLPEINHNQSFAETKNDNQKLSIEDVLEKNKDLFENNDSEKINRWTVAPNAAPVYFNSLGEGSSIDPQFNSNSKSGEVNMSYGISASFALNNKISIRSGINKVDLGYNTNDVIIFQTTGAAAQGSLQNVSESATRNDNVAIASEANFNDAPLVFNSVNTTLNQSFGYIEIPLEIQYSLTNKKFGLNVIGGFSSFFLNNNEIFSEAQNGPRTFLGEANNLNKVSYSANFGLGFNYKITEKFDLNLEPMFKYQINTFNNTSGNFKPYILGVYTGFAIKF